MLLDSVIVQPEGLHFLFIPFNLQFPALEPPRLHHPLNLVVILNYTLEQRVLPRLHHHALHVQIQLALRNHALHAFKIYLIYIYPRGNSLHRLEYNFTYIIIHY